MCETTITNCVCHYHTFVTVEITDSFQRFGRQPKLPTCKNCIKQSHSWYKVVQSEPKQLMIVNVRYFGPPPSSSFSFSFRARVSGPGVLLSIAHV